MREILFRGKRLDNGEWVEGAFLPENETYPATIFGGVRHSVGDYVDPATIGQYTGLKDKNGKRIFEGDIIRMHGNPDDIAEIKFGEFGCVDIQLESRTDIVLGWYYKPLPTDAVSQLEPFCWEFQLNKMWIEENDIDVIGNIHDNPELVEGLKNGKE